MASITKKLKYEFSGAKGERNRAGYLLILPFFLLFAVFIIIPVVWTMVLSLYDYNIVQPMKWTGFDNYIYLFIQDKLFRVALKNTLVLAAITGPVGFLFSFFFAWVINQLRCKNLFSMAFYIPSITSGVAISAIWLYIFSGDRYGLINNLLLQLNLTDKPILWTTDPKYIFILVIIISLWMSLGSGFLTNLAGLNTIPSHVYEAAQVDGINNKIQEAIYITLPLMKPQLLFNAIMCLVSSLNIYDVTVAIAGFPSPDYSVHTIVAHMYDHGFIRFELGYASAVAFVLFLLNFLLGKIFMKLLSSED